MERDLGTGVFSPDLGAVSLRSLLVVAGSNYYFRW
jgi:hypothetical protein